jgi:hypothetical protein
MFKKELQDTLKSFTDLLLLTAGIILVSFFLSRVILGIKIAFSDILHPLSWAVMFLLAFTLGSTLFSRERSGEVFEYFFSLPLDRWKVLLYKVFPRFLAFCLFFLITLAVNMGIFNNPPPLDTGMLFILLLAIFLVSVSQSLLHKKSLTIIIINMFGFSLLFGIAWALMHLIGENRTGILMGYFTAVFTLISLVLFIGFALRFRIMDMDNMERLSRKNLFQVLLPVGIFLLLFIGVNLMDTAKPADAFTMDNLLPASLDKSNGFYRLWTLAEPAGTDVQADAVIDKYRDLVNPQGNKKKTPDKFDANTYKSMTEKNTGNIKLYIETPVGIRQDIWKYLSSPEFNLKKIRQESSFLLERYQALVETPQVEDFSPPRRWGSNFSYLAWLRLGNLYTAINAADAINGQWEKGIGNLLTQIAFSRKLAKNSRTLITNLLAKSEARRALNMLAELMNRQDCPREAYQQILAGLPPLNNEDFKTKNSLIFEALSFENFLKTVISEGKGSFGDPFQQITLRLFTQENRTFGFVDRYTKHAIQLEDTPPYRWKSEPSKIKVDQGMFWWFINPGGKMLIREVLISITALSLRTYRVRTCYDMTRISAELHLEDDPSQPVQQVLNRLTTYTQTVDPCSGKPYIWNSQKRILYSIGTDRKDDHGKNDMSTYQADFVLPVRLKGRK